MKTSISIICYIISFHFAIGQVGIGNTDPKASLDITASNATSPSNTDGILIPRVSALAAQAAMTTDQDGILVFYTGTGLQGKGYYFWDHGNTSWEKINHNVTDNQNLSLSGTTLSIEDGNSVNFSALQDDDWYRANTTSPATTINSSIFTFGRVGIGFNNPSYTLDVRGSSSTYLAQIYNTNASTNDDGLRIRLGDASSTSNNHFISFNSGTGIQRGRIQGGAGLSGNGITYSTTSDRRLKTNIYNIDNALQLINKIQPRLYEYKENLGVKEYGFIAQELQPIYPQAVTGSPDSDVIKNPMMVDYGRLTPILTAGIKELKQEVDTLKTKLKKFEALEARLTALEAGIKVNSTKL